MCVTCSVLSAIRAVGVRGAVSRDSFTSVDVLKETDNFSHVSTGPPLRSTPVRQTSTGQKAFYWNAANWPELYRCQPLGALLFSFLWFFRCVMWCHVTCGSAHILVAVLRGLFERTDVLSRVLTADIVAGEELQEADRQTGVRQTDGPQVMQTPPDLRGGAAQGPLGALAPGPGEVQAGGPVIRPQQRFLQSQRTVRPRPLTQDKLSARGGGLTSSLRHRLTSRGSSA